MPQLAIAPSFLDDFSQMDRDIQLATLSVMRDFIADRGVDTSVGTNEVRVLSLDDDWSGVIVPRSEDLYCLVTVRPRAEALAYAHAYTPEPEPTTPLGTVPAPRVPSTGLPRVNDEPIVAPAALTAVVNAPFGPWRTYLHPRHRPLTHGNFAGSTQVTGSPATGIGTIPLHRAGALARRVGGRAEAETAGGVPERVLLVTAQAARAQTLSHHLDELLGDSDDRARLDVTTIGGLAQGVVAESIGHRPQVLTREELVADWQRMAEADGVPFTGRFLVDEWEHVLLAQEIADPAAYLRCDRNGRRVHLAPEYRRGVWRTIQRYAGAMRAHNNWGRIHLAARAAETVRRAGPRYRHVVVDAVHAFHPTHLRLVRAIVPPGADDVFLTGDPAQRVTEPRVSLAALGIHVRGRARILRDGYRTTKEIEEFATGIRTNTTHRAPWSTLRGPRPTVHQATGRAEEYDAVTRLVGHWVERDGEPHAIAVAGRNHWIVRRLRKELEAAGVRTAPVTAVDDPGAVRVDTMHQLAGQEFRRVALVGLGETLVPPRAALRSTGGDPVSLAQVHTTERNVLYAAAMSARDSLYLSYADTPSRLLPRD
ncbi:RNA helicase [Spiractinospora alimapuensis]|nr:RNA helicase [Spiractinospora alimapuensis]